MIERVLLYLKDMEVNFHLVRKEQALAHLRFTVFFLLYSIVVTRPLGHNIVCSFSVLVQDLIFIIWQLRICFIVSFAFTCHSLYLIAAVCVLPFSKVLMTKLSACMCTEAVLANVLVLSDLKKVAINLQGGALLKCAYLWLDLFFMTRYHCLTQAR